MLDIYYVDMCSYQHVPAPGRPGLLSRAGGGACGGANTVTPAWGAGAPWLHYSHNTLCLGGEIQCPHHHSVLRYWQWCRPGLGWAGLGWARWQI